MYNYINSEFTLTVIIYLGAKRIQQSSQKLKDDGEINEKNNKLDKNNKM